MSKYDEYWKKLPLANIARDARELGRTSLNVSELTILGQRSVASWKSVVRFDKYRRLSGNAAHLNALVHHLQPYLREKEVFRLRTTFESPNCIVLDVEIITVTKPEIEPKNRLYEIEPATGEVLPLHETYERIHQILEPLPKYDAPRKALLLNGLYVFYENGEVCAHTGKPRIVRVGNHPRSQNRLITRLKEHYGEINYPEKKNGSVFRRLLGGAILRRRDPNHPCLLPIPGKGHWEKQGAKTCGHCRPLEDEVTALLKRAFRFKCIEILNIEERNEMEKKLVASLARCNMSQGCGPSEAWLGRWAYSEKFGALVYGTQTTWMIRMK